MKEQGPESWGKLGHHREGGRLCGPGSWPRGADKPHMTSEETVTHS